MNIVLLEKLGISDELLEIYANRLRNQGHTFTAYERNTDTEIMIDRAKDADVLMLANMPLPGTVINACSKLKFIDVAFTGVDHIDIETAKKRGIAVSNASGYSNEAVAELVLGMAIQLFRNIPAVEKRCREQGTKEGLVGRELKGHTVGIIGYGAIGSRVAELFNAFGCNILVYSRSKKDEIPDYVQYVTLEQLLKSSHIVTLHCPLNDETRGMIDKEEISLMKDRAILINAARGPIVNSEELAEALRSGKIAGAGIDVFETEPPIESNHPLLTAPNCRVTPHIAFATEESMKLRAEIVFDSLDKWMAGKQINIILPD